MFYLKNSGSAYLGGVHFPAKQTNKQVEIYIFPIQSILKTYNRYKNEELRERTFDIWAKFRCSVVKSTEHSPVPELCLSAGRVEL